ncbi:hypothetical protein [Prochlorothrix hollandica]|uniref:Uncharacterized protein n=1 Tax=Prochlorothrix hollandica PCC 9006 = CALU 1027 TaxID=317619 RepID=A0A0M2PZM0_PROHO|nr:hypothetical protein [Prochlorothrix hollandica]KKJ00154.1 hypothetical protein PROH_10565 [Prochlorothrix hollandica PCC 9006 = CALU 1027]
MKFLNFLRWIFFIPLGLVASALAGTLATLLLTIIGKAGYFGGASWYVWLINGLVTAYSLAWVSFYIAPKITRFCKWFIVGLMLVMGVSTFILVPAMNIERVQMTSGVSMTMMSFIMASWSPEEIERNLGLYNKKQG